MTDIVRPPLRAITIRGAGSSQLACSHVVTTPKNHNTRSVRCEGCLTVEQRRAWWAHQEAARVAREPKISHRY